MGEETERYKVIAEKRFSAGRAPPSIGSPSVTAGEFPWSILIHVCPYKRTTVPPGGIGRKTPIGASFSET